ncbi:hypothetical protein GCM10010405_53440 [Streptomyces macrosporus]|uniref:Uncharacterized protein n=1 Tax=Streptomyces macrosporus TaxID=44032 RepID=A0ABP5XNW9_9ACTN
MRGGRLAATARRCGASQTEDGPPDGEGRRGTAGDGEEREEGRKNAGNGREASGRAREEAERDAEPERRGGGKGTGGGRIDPVRCVPARRSSCSTALQWADGAPTAVAPAGPITIRERMTCGR